MIDEQLFANIVEIIEDNCEVDDDNRPYRRVINAATVANLIMHVLEDAYRQGQEDMRELAAQDVECGCDNAWVVADCHHSNSAARWNLCGRNPCGAINAMSIRELPIKDYSND